MLIIGGRDLKIRNVGCVFVILHGDRQKRVLYSFSYCKFKIHSIKSGENLIRVSSGA